MSSPGQDALERARRATEVALELIGKDLLEKAQADVSIDSGDLHDSGRVDPPVAEGDRITVGVGFHTRYAAAQHEGAWSYIRDGKRVVAVVRNHPGGGKTHFLSDNLKALFPTYGPRVAKIVKSEMGD